MLNKSLLIHNNVITDMEVKYYIALFNEETWNEFLEKGSSVYGTTLSKRRNIEKIIPGDFLVCYVTKLSRFVGLLEISSKAYVDDSHVWESNIYPSRINVHPVYILKVINGIPISELKEDLPSCKNFRTSQSWRGIVRTSLTTIREEDAKIIIDKLKKASNE